MGWAGVLVCIFFADSLEYLTNSRYFSKFEFFKSRWLEGVWSAKCSLAINTCERNGGGSWIGQKSKCVQENRMPADSSNWVFSYLAFQEMSFARDKGGRPHTDLSWYKTVSCELPVLYMFNFYMNTNTVLYNI